MVDPADFSPVTDRWRLRFPLWTRYPGDPNGEYPFVRNGGAGRILRLEGPSGSRSRWIGTILSPLASSKSRKRAVVV
jgi:hypothetical protein